ncbi:hypothetical protein J1605_003749 [Eschrichtius robustus]|uniref:Uncharacterized protein n=1 Tax=Eschrichtius robustus TaxID=9764 RepID=A0AB34HPN0_ESCRO|nr:hypothetical protein J1605_003749 [Eschrichtius robustus]
MCAHLVPRRTPPRIPSSLLRAYLSTMKGSRALSGPSGPPEGSPESMDLSLTGLPPPMSRRPNSASTAKPIARSISVVTGSEPRRKMLEAPGPGGSRAVSNLRRSNSATQVNQPQASQAWPGPLRDVDLKATIPLPAPLPCPCCAFPVGVVVATGQDDQPRAFTLPPDAQSPGTLDVLVGPRRRECTVPLAPNFTANNRHVQSQGPQFSPSNLGFCSVECPGGAFSGPKKGSTGRDTETTPQSNKGAVGNCVTTMVHNHYTPSEKVPPPKSSNHMAPSLK